MKEISDGSKILIDISEDPAESLSDLPDFAIFLNDLEILKSETEWYKDSIMFKIMQLLKSSCPLTGGLQDPVAVAKNKAAVPTSPYVQAMHVHGDHWICISNKFCQTPNQVEVFDSLGGEYIDEDGIRSIVYYHNRGSSPVEIFLVETQHQSNDNDCGPFALAFASFLCKNEDPAMFDFDAPSLRGHIRDCFLQKKVTSFPGTAKANGVERRVRRIFTGTCGSYFLAA